MPARRPRERRSGYPAAREHDRKGGSDAIPTYSVSVRRPSGGAGGCSRDLLRRPHRQATPQLRTLTARAMTSTAISNDTADCTSMSIFAHRDIGITSVGLNAVALVNER